MFCICVPKFKVTDLYKYFTSIFIIYYVIFIIKKINILYNIIKLNNKDNFLFLHFIIIIKHK